MGVFLKVNATKKNFSLQKTLFQSIICMKNKFVAFDEDILF